MTFAIRFLTAVLLFPLAATAHASALQNSPGSQAASADPAPSSVVEFYNPDLDNYFITADPGEQAFVDTGAVGRWQRTGLGFRSGGPNQVCRFYGNGAANPATGAIFGPNSHFYTVDATECAGLKASFDPNAKSWKFESNDFATGVPVNGACASGLIPVYRLYNNGFGRGIDSNHRFTTSSSVYQQMLSKGWRAEGVVMCAPAETPVSSGPTVSAVTPGPLMFRKSARFTVSGQNLDRGIKLAAPDCSNIAELAGGTALQRVFTCTPAVTGTLAVAVVGAGGAALWTSSVVVPLPQVSLKTSMGEVVLELYPSNAPITVDNFLQYVADDFYKDKIFHRVINDFMIQSGGYNAALQEATTRPAIKLEMPNGLSNIRGAIAMARNSAPDSATSQFFINVVDNIRLDTETNGGYAVFGKVVSGMSVVDQIKAVPTQFAGGMPDVPITPVVITAAQQTR